MRTPHLRRLGVAGVLALTVATPLAACGAAPLAPLPVQAANPTPSGATTPSVPPSGPATTPGAPPRGAAKPTTRRPAPIATTTRTRTTPPAPPTSPPTCMGAVRHEINVQEEVLELIPSLCFHTGGTLRLFQIGPGLVTVTPENLRTTRYAAAVHDVTFIRPGTAEVSFPLDGQTHTITVVVID